MDVLERDFYEERRRKWRRSAFWRGFIAASVLGLIISAFAFGGSLGEGGEHVARFEVKGLIVDDLERELLLGKLAEDDSARAVIVRINSPGGTTAGSEAIYQSLLSVAGEKPVVAVMSEVAASGGYITAIAADHIIARGNTITGSIGVIMEYPDVTSVMEKIGISMQTVRSSELKAEPSPFRPPNPAARALDEAMVADSYNWFSDLVGERRDLKGNALGAVTTGEIFTGRAALENGLIDEIGGENEAVDWLESQQEGLDELPIRDWAVEGERGVLPRILGKLGASTGILGEISAWQAGKLYSIGP